MTEQMRCWQCGVEMSVGTETVGTSVDCPHCSASVYVPGELFGEPMASFATSRGQDTMSKSPLGAAVLNFFFWGAGYLYVGRMWGLWILLPFCFLRGAAMAKPDAHTPSTVTFLLVNFVGLFMAVHAYGIAKEDR